MPAYSILAFALAGSLAAFLIFNFHPAKIFMGDTGSLLIGLINSILVIKFIEVAQCGKCSLPHYRFTSYWFCHPDDTIAGYITGIFYPYCEPPVAI